MCASDARQRVRFLAANANGETNSVAFVAGCREIRQGNDSLRRGLYGLIGRAFGGAPASDELAVTGENVLDEVVAHV